MKNGNGNGKKADPFLDDLFPRRRGRQLTTEERIEVLQAKVIGIEKELISLRLAFPTEGSMTAIVETVYAKEHGELSRLRDDVVRLLALMVRLGKLDQDELNQELAPRA